MKCSDQLCSHYVCNIFGIPTIVYVDTRSVCGIVLQCENGWRIRGVREWCLCNGSFEATLSGFLEMCYGHLCMGHSVLYVRVWKLVTGEFPTCLYTLQGVRRRGDTPRTCRKVIVVESTARVTIKAPGVLTNGAVSEPSFRAPRAARNMPRATTWKREAVPTINTRMPRRLIQLLCLSSCITVEPYRNKCRFSKYSALHTKSLSDPYSFL